MEATQEAMNAASALEGQPRWLPDAKIPKGGGARVSGSVTNKVLEEGTTVNVVFTFYGDGDVPLGTVAASVNVGATDMSELIDAQFDSAEMVWGYTYELTIE